MGVGYAAVRQNRSIFHEATLAISSRDRYIYSRALFGSLIRVGVYGG